MAPRPRVVASDLDGTLLRSDGTVSDRTVHAIERFEAAGGIFVVVTARPPRWLAGLRGRLGSHPIAICGNGAFVYDVALDRVVEEFPLDAATASELVEDLLRRVPGIVFAAERGSGVTYAVDFPDRDGTAPGAPELLVGELAAEPVGKLLARHPHMRSREFFDAVREVVGDRGALAYSGAVGLAEITAPGATKGLALQRWSEEHGIPACDVWAFGDMFNDLPMLGWAGVGYAVGNAHPDVRAAADRVCGTNDEDGVAAVIEALLIAE